MARRLAAAVFAVAVIAGGLAIRNANDDSGQPRRSTATTDPTDPYRLLQDHSVTLLCAEEVAQLCDDLDYVVSDTRVEPAWTTVDRLAAGGQLGADAWVTFRPLEEMAAAPPPVKRALGQATLLGRSAIVLAGPSTAVAAVDAACPNPRKLVSCAAAAEGVQLMLRDPTSSPAGALALSVAADEHIAPQAGTPAAPGPVDQLGQLLARSRGTPSPYEDVARLKASAVALTLEADVNLAFDKLGFAERHSSDLVGVRYPFEARAVELVMVPSSTFDRPRDLVTVFGSRTVSSSVNQLGFDVPGRSRSYAASKAFALRPTIRYDLPPPSPERLRQLRALPAAGNAVRLP